MGTSWPSENSCFSRRTLLRRVSQLNSASASALSERTSDNQDWAYLFDQQISSMWQKLHCTLHNSFPELSEFYLCGEMADHFVGPKKCTLVQALRLCTDRTAHRGSRGIALPFHDLGSRRGWGVSATPRLLFIPRKHPVPIVQEAGWAPRLVWTGVENLAPTGIRSPDHPAHSQLLYWLRYPAHLLVKNKCKRYHENDVNYAIVMKQ